MRIPNDLDPYCLLLRPLSQEGNHHPISLIVMRMTSAHHGLPCGSSPALCFRHRLSYEAFDQHPLLPPFGSKIAAVRCNLSCPSDAASSNKLNHCQE